MSQVSGPWPGRAPSWPGQEGPGVSFWWRFYSELPSRGAAAEEASGRNVYVRRRSGRETPLGSQGRRERKQVLKNKKKRKSRSSRRKQLPREMSLLWRESSEIPTGLPPPGERWALRRGAAAAAGGPPPQPRRGKGLTERLSEPNGRRPGRRWTAPGRGGGPRGRGRENSAVPTAVPADAQRSPGSGAPSSTTSRPRLPPSSPSPSFPPPLTEPEPAAIRRGFRPGAERKTRERPRTGTASPAPEEPLGG